MTVEGTGADPKALVKRAIELKRAANATGRGAARACVWAVFDRDEHERFDEACQLARTNDIQLAVSNPCFELWAVFHYRDYGAFIDRDHCQRLLETLCGDYRRRRSKLFTDTEVIDDQYRAAVDRAKRSLRDRKLEGDPKGNLPRPCTC